MSMHACVQHTMWMCRTLNWAVNDLPLQDFFYPILGVSSSGPEGGAIAWDFFQTNFQKVHPHACHQQGAFLTCGDRMAGAMLAQIKAKVGNASPSLMTATVSYSCYGLTSTKDINEIEAFFRMNPLPSSERGISQMLEVRVSKI